jgi:hypothetical protein
VEHAAEFGWCGARGHPAALRLEEIDSAARDLTTVVLRFYRRMEQGHPLTAEEQRMFGEARCQLERLVSAYVEAA